MKILKLLNKKILSITLVCLIFFTAVFAEEKPIDIWNIEKKDNQVISETNISSENSSVTTQNSVYELQTNKQTDTIKPVSYTHLRAHETRGNLVCRLLLEKKNH